MNLLYYFLGSFCIKCTVLYWDWKFWAIQSDLYVDLLKGLLDYSINLSKYYCTVYHHSLIIIKGAVLGPEEFLEGLALGSHQFLSGTVGKFFNSFS